MCVHSSFGSISNLSWIQRTRKGKESDIISLPNIKINSLATEHQSSQKRKDPKEAQLRETAKQPQDKQ